MNDRERLIKTVHFEEVDRLPMRHAYGLMPGVLEDWYAEGLPRSVKTRQNEYDVANRFKQNRWATSPFLRYLNCSGLNTE